MPQDHRRQIRQVGQHRHGDPEMAEQGDAFLLVFFAQPDGAVLSQPVAGQQRVDSVRGFLPDCLDVSPLEEWNLRPCVNIQRAGEGSPQSGLQIPGQAFLPGFRIDVAAAEFRQPGERLGGAAHFGQRETRRIPGPAQGRNVIIPNVIFCHSLAQQFRFHPPLWGQ